MNAIQNLTVLGSTGSVGANTLDVVERHPDRFRVLALTAHGKADVLFDQCLRHRPRYAVLADADAAENLARRARDSGLETEVLHGHEGLELVAALPETDTVMAAIVGIAGLRATFAAAAAGKNCLLYTSPSPRDS